VLDLIAQMGEPNKFADFIDKLARTPLSQVVYFVAACTILRIALYPVLARSKPHQRGGGYTAARILNESLDAIVYAGVFVFLLIRPFGIQAFKIPTGSMLNTLQINDFIVANKAIYRYTDPKHGDIVVFKPPERAKQPGQGDVDFIKRCIGIPGDVVEIRDGQLYRNGVAVPEPYVFYLYPDNTPNPRRVPEEERWQFEYDFKIVEYRGQIWPVSIRGEAVNTHGLPTVDEFQADDEAMMQELKSLPPAKIPPGHYLFMGDNRFGSLDGRAWGLVPRSDIIGRSEFVWFPPGRWGRTR
jgi:signal peptidase I